MLKSDNGSTKRAFIYKYRYMFVHKIFTNKIQLLTFKHLINSDHTVFYSRNSRMISIRKILSMQFSVFVDQGRKIT